MTILLPLTIILAGVGYFTYQTYHWAKKRQQPKVQKLNALTNKPTHESAELDQERIIPYQRPLFFNWKDQICFALFGKQTWIRYRQGYQRARFAINYFYPTCWLTFFGLFSVLSKLLAKVFFAWPLNWFFWASLGVLPLLAGLLFWQIRQLKQIPLNERRQHGNN
ncbi:MAG: hypothetical protein MRECE_9c032 [Mycoplasmataceae bacterium CE_OT135]|nr:MAG: hypothetical protein MRECE_9c032 [Mycoplasmataceae bacterium CE_OT135]